MTGRPTPGHTPPSPGDNDNDGDARRAGHDTPGTNDSEAPQAIVADAGSAGQRIVVTLGLTIEDVQLISGAPPLTATRDNDKPKPRRHIVLVSCDNNDCIQVLPAGEIRVAPGDDILFITWNKDATLTFPADLTADTSKNITRGSDDDPTNGAGLVRIKANAKKDGKKTRYDEWDVEIDGCRLCGQTNHPAIIVNGS